MGKKCTGFKRKKTELQEIKIKEKNLTIPLSQRVDLHAPPFPPAALPCSDL